MAFVLNTLIYTENASVRGANVADYSSQSYADEIERVNQNHIQKLAQDEGKTYSDLEIGLERMNENTSEVLREDLARRGILSASEITETERGTSLYQTETQRFLNSEDEPDWDVIENVGSEEHSAFRLAVRNDSLSTQTFPLSLFGSEFEMVLDTVDVDEDPDGTFYVYKNPTRSVVFLEYQDADGNTVGSCSVSASGDYTTIDFTQYTFNDFLCEPLTNIDTAETFRIENGDEVEGQFTIVSTGELNQVSSSGNYYADTESTYPQRSPILYSAGVETTYTDVRTAHTQRQNLILGDIYDIGDE